MSGQARLFSDFTRENRAVDVFPDDSFSLTTATTSAGGVNVLTTTSCKDGQPLHSTVSPAFTWAEHDISFTFGLNQKFSKRVVNGSPTGVRFSSFEANALKLAPLGFKGSSVGGGVLYKQSSDPSGKAHGSWQINGNAAFNNELLATDALVAYDVENGGLNQSDFSLAFEHSNVGLGAGVSLFPLPGSPLVHAGLAYRQPKYSAQISAGVDENKAVQSDLDLFLQHSPEVAVAVNAGGKFDDKYQLQKHQYSVGASYKIDKCEIKASVVVKKKEENKARLNFSITQNLNAYCVATVSANLNANSLIGKQGGKDHSFGLLLSIE